jgi:hypothetical protein
MANVRCSDCESSVDPAAAVYVKGQPFCYDCADEALGDLDYDDLEYGPPDTPSLEDHPMYDHVHNRNPYFPGEGY